LQSLSCNHAFIDGNKRVAFATCAIFLRLNGYEMKVNARTAERFLVSRVISGHADLQEMAKWIEKTLSLVSAIKGTAVRGDGGDK